ncbi:PREDICTED: uncharacterized protein LOC109464112 [Branchiostoma belcheri]|uniref:Uncharacterized protein LOC109464112 n=1 Tax=Branchiostoma belcheri TaxID=7741 RepID=A0A6P4Y2G5_BRABE|nr:PREDICTED: uncharacterized protein LOC109464112 [Branchiostoma belcheri]
MERYGHVIVATITCPKKHTWKWHSSSSVGGKYYVNQRVVHAFTSTGMAPVKYETFCEAAKLGVNGEAYVKNKHKRAEGHLLCETLPRHQETVTHCSSACAEA